MARYYINIPQHLRHIDPHVVLPKSWTLPIFVANGAAEIPAGAVAEASELLKTANFSATYNGAAPQTRRSRSLPVDKIPAPVLNAFQEFSPIAYRFFNFSAAAPIPGAYQYLGYSGEEGGKFDTHFDNGIFLNGQYYVNNPERAMTMLIYLNDDYEGGELVFPYIVDGDGAQLTYKPRAGDVVAFPSNFYFSHYVTPVTSGERFVATQWFADPAVIKTIGVLPSELRFNLDDGKWQYGHRSHAKFDPVSNNYYWQQMFVERIKPQEAETTAFECEEVLYKSFPHLHKIWQYLLNSATFGHKLHRVYANAHTFGIEGSIHRDAEHSRYYTTLIYAMDEWEQDWGGATEFFPLGLEKQVISILPEPWKIIQFRGDIPHKATSVGRNCKALRKTLMFKSIRLAELNPNARPHFNFYGTTTATVPSESGCAPCAARANALLK